MNSLLLILAALAVAGAVWVGVDIVRFARAKKKAEKPDALGCDAGGILFVQGGKTYYEMPNQRGRRKIADYAMDLRPGSPDMEMFKTVMNQARAEHEAEAKKAKSDAIANVKAVAKESANGTD